MRVVIDTNVLVSGLKSRQGASFALLQRLGTDEFTPVVSPPLYVEYEEVLMRPGMLPALTAADISDFLDYLLSVSDEAKIYFLWRPHLSDPKDDLVLEVALAGSVSHIVSYNIKDFAGLAPLGISVVTPGQFLHILGQP